MTARRDVVPLSPLQHGLLFLAEFDRESIDVYYAQLVIEIEGDLDRDRLAEAGQYVLQRHDSLRACFRTRRSGEPVQIIRNDVTLPWSDVDLTGLPLDEQDERVRTLVTQDRLRRFALATGPLVRATLIRRHSPDRHGDLRHTLVLTAHHIVVDGWSLPLLGNELLARYGGRDLPPPVPYRRYLSWLARRDQDASRQAWQRVLAGVAQPTRLAEGAAAPGAYDLPEAVDTELPAVDTAALAAQCQARGLTLNSVIRAAWAVLIGRLTGRDDVLFGAVTSGRSAEIDGAEAMVGLLANTVPVRVALPLGASLADLALAVQDQQLRLLPHEHVPLGELVHQFGVGELFDTVVMFQNYASDLGFLDGMSGLHVVSTHGSSATHYPLALIVTPGDRLGLRLQFAPSLFAREQVEAVVRRLARILRSDLDAVAAQVDLLDPDERRRVLDEFNATDVRWSAAGAAGRSAAAPAGRSAVTAGDRTAAVPADLLAAQAVATPAAIALRVGAQTWTYRRLHERSALVARALAARGVAPGQIVAIAAARSAELVVSVLAVLAAGAAYLPIDPDYPPDRVRFMLDDAKPVLVIGDGAGPVAGLGGDGGVASVDDLAATGAGAAGTVPATTASAADPAYVIYTSGSTGRPKGVVVPNGALTNFLLDMRQRLRIDRASRVLATTTFGFDICHLELLLPLIAGAEVDLVDRETVRDPDRLAELIRVDDPSLLQATPTLWQALDAEHPDVLRGRRVISGGEALGGALAARLAEHTGELINMYGPTETTIWSTAGTVDAADAAHPSIGRPIANTQVYVLDRGLQPCPVAVGGELYIAGAGLASAYLNRPELTAVRFVANPFGPPGSRMYRTGDLARWHADGRLEYLGRVDHQVKIRGHRIELGEIEAVLAEYPQVAEVAVVARTDLPGQARLVAYPVPVPGATLDERELRAYAVRLLPEHMVPSAVVVLPRLPQTPNGKLDRKALPAPEPATGRAHRSAVTPVQEILCGIVADLLGVASVGLDDNFLALGGHSLLATRVAGRVRSALGVEMSLRDIFESQTMAELARRVSADAQPRPALRALPDGAAVRLAPAQRRLWFVNRLLDGSGSYNIAWAVCLSGPVDVDALRAAVRDLVERHETLRTVFPAEDGEPRMLVLDEPGELMVLRLPPSDSDGEREQLLSATLTAQATRGFDLEREPALRALLVVVGADEYVLMLTVHHIAADGWSLGPLSRDLAAAYVARRAGHAPGWPSLPVRYRDYAEWHRQLLGDEDDPDSLGRRQLAYWSAALAGLPDEVHLPTDLPRPAVASGRGGVRVSSVDAGTHAAIIRLARDGGATSFMVVQAALAALLTRLGAGTDLPIGVPVAGRTDEATEPLVGFFVNTLVLRTDTAADPTFRELVARVRETDLAALAHADVPFERVVEVCNPARSLARHPLFQVLLAFQGAQEPIRELAGIRARPQPVPTGMSRFDLVLQVAEAYDDQGRPAGLELAVEYSADLFHESTAATLLERFGLLLRAAVADPARRLSRLDVLLPGERERLLSAARGPHRQVPGQSLAELFVARAQAAPDHPAVIEAEQSLSYAEIDQRSDRLARELIARGAGPGTLVALWLPRSAGLVTSILAVLKAGAAYLPIDPTHPPARVRDLLQDARPLLTLADRARPDLDVTPLAEALLATQPVGAAAEVPLPVPVPPQASAYVVYTSGSTGRPKGVQVSHGSLVALATDQGARLGLGPQTRGLHFASPGFDAAAGEIFLTLLAGGTLVVLPDQTRVDGPALAAAVHRHGVTLAGLPPAVLAAFPPECAFPVDLTLLVAGEACPAAVVDRWSAGRTMINAYGPTEATVTATMSAPLSPGAGAPPIGRPLANTCAYVLDAGLAPVPDGVTGELYLAGQLLAVGYRNRPGLTAERFVADPYGPAGSRMYRTGDLVRRRSDGDLVYVGRDDDQVQVRGHRVEPAEIEVVLLRHPQVAQATVVPLRDQPGPTRLAAYVVAVSGVADGQELPRRLREYLAERLPAYLVPAAIVPLDALPLTGRGKVDRAALPAVDLGGASAGRPPRNEREARLCAVVADVLGLPRASIDDNFFSLGGDSISAIRLVSRAADAGVQLAVADVFLHPTVAGLVDGQPAEPLAGLLADVLPLRAGDDRPPLFCVHGALGLSAAFGTLAAALDPRQPVYALQSPTLRTGHPAGSVEELAAEYLRTVRTLVPTGPVHLLGWSFGGLVAYEMARLVEAAGEPAGFVGLLDSYPVRDGDPEPGEQEILFGLLENAGAVPVPDDRPLDVSGVLAALRRSEGLLALLDESTLRRALDVTRQHVTLAARYRPGRFAGPVTLFTATGRIAESGGDAALGSGPEPGGDAAPRSGPEPRSGAALGSGAQPGGGPDRVPGGAAPNDLVARWTEVIGDRLTVHEVACGHEHMLDRDPAASIAAHIAARIGPAPRHTKGGEREQPLRRRGRDIPGTRERRQAALPVARDGTRTDRVAGGTAAGIACQGTGVRRDPLARPATRQPRGAYQDGRGDVTVPGTSDLVVQTVDLRKRYRDFVALDGVNLALPAGSVLGLLGPNGAGKTTTIRILSSVIRPDGGMARVAGFDVVRSPYEVRRRIGMAGQFAAVDGLLTGRENLVLIGRLMHLGRAGARRRAEELLARFDLLAAGDKPVHTYSGGMRRRLDLAGCLVGRPPVLFLDEPTTGLDPVSRAALWDMVRESVAEGVGVLLTTQYLDEADRLADQVVVVDHGKVIAEGSPESLKGKTRAARFEVTVAHGDELGVACAALDRILPEEPAVDPDTCRVSVPLHDSLNQVAAIARTLQDAGVEVVDLAVHRPTLDDVFLQLTGGHDRLVGRTDAALAGAGASAGGGDTRGHDTREEQR